MTTTTSVPADKLLLFGSSGVRQALVLHLGLKGRNPGVGWVGLSVVLEALGENLLPAHQVVAWIQLLVAVRLQSPLPHG